MFYPTENGFSLHEGVFLKHVTRQACWLRARVESKML